MRKFTSVTLPAVSPAQPLSRELQGYVDLGHDLHTSFQAVAQQATTSGQETLHELAYELAAAARNVTKLLETEPRQSPYALNQANILREWWDGVFKRDFTILDGTLISHGAPLPLVDVEAEQSTLLGLLRGRPKRTHNESAFEINGQDVRMGMRRFLEGALMYFENPDQPLSHPNPTFKSVLTNQEPRP